MYFLGRLSFDMSLFSSKYGYLIVVFSADQQDGEDEPMETGQFDDAEDM